MNITHIIVGGLILLAFVGLIVALTEEVAAMIGDMGEEVSDELSEDTKKEDSDGDYD